MRFKKFDLNLLVTLDALLAERSVSRAAQRLHLSPSATSDALARLRDYFEDELLVQVGRRMEPTARAEGLQHAVRDMLVRLDNTITAQPHFEPAKSDRVFRIYASDYTQMVLAPHLMRRAALVGCRAGFDFLPQVAKPQRDLERGDADLLILPKALMSEEHPSEVLYEESFACMVWAGSPLATGTLTRERYLAAGHVIMRPQAQGGESSYEDGLLKRQGFGKKVVATSYGFATVPALLVGTDSIATLHARLAHLLRGVWPLVIRPCPIDIPPMTQALQWHSYRTQDPGLEWLRQLMHAAAADLISGDAVA